MEVPTKSIKYRSDIDGLRGLAVLGVLIYHGEFSFGENLILPGGYLGVDVFFVISGFLITSLILKEIRTEGRFDVWAFYGRRSRRLLPALTAVIIASIPVALLLLSPTQLIDFSKSVFSSLFFVSNVYWWDTLAGYGAEAANFKPFLHTWSLGVEEQFYILYPLLAVLAFKSLRKAWLVILSLTAASLVVTLVFAGVDRSLVFFMIPFRLWELLAGALLACVLIRKEVESIGGGSRTILLASGLALIAGSFVFIEFEKWTPGLANIIPVLGTVLVIYSADQRSFLSVALSNKALVFVGLISYSLYLWHYPVLVFGRIWLGELSLMEKVGCIALAFFASIVSFRFIEKPFRDRARVGRKMFRVSVGFGILTISTCALYAIQKDGLRDRFSDREISYGGVEWDNQSLFKKTYTILPKLAESAGYSDWTDYAERELWFSQNKDTTKILIVGNSHAVDLFHAFHLNQSLFPDREFAVYHLKKLDDAEDKYLKLVGSPNFKASDLILFSNRFVKGTVKGVEQDDFRALDLLIDRFLLSGKNVAVSSNTMEFRTPGNGLTIYDELKKQNEVRMTFNNIGNAYYEGALEKIDEVNRKVQAIAEEKGVPFLEKKDYMCDEDGKIYYGSTPDGFKVFFDYGHYTQKGASFFGQKIHEIGWLDSVDL